MTSLHSPTLILFDKARQALTEAHAVDEVKDIRDQAEALRAYYKQRDGSLEMVNQCAEIKVRAERRLGELLAGTVRAGNPQLSDDATIGRLPEGISRDQSSDWQAIARIPEPEFEAHIAETKEAGLPLSTAGILRQPHVSFNSGNNEWYTPSAYIEAARTVLGRIDLDPASTASANEVVKAESFFTSADDGLTRHWFGRVWMNPPYEGELIGRFTAKMVHHFDELDIESAIVLVNNATETAWFARLHYSVIERETMTDMEAIARLTTDLANAALTAIDPAGQPEQTVTPEALATQLVSTGLLRELLDAQRELTALRASLSPAADESLGTVPLGRTLHDLPNTGEPTAPTALRWPEVNE